LELLLTLTKKNAFSKSFVEKYVNSVETMFKDDPELGRLENAHHSVSAILLKQMRLLAESNQREYFLRLISEFPFAAKVSQPLQSAPFSLVVSKEGVQVVENTQPDFGPEWYYDPKRNEEKMFCWNCTKRDETLKGFKKCSRCKEARYCSRECQKENWPEHKKSCARRE